MLGFAIWTLLREPHTLVPREASPWEHWKIVTAAALLGREPSVLERQRLLAEDSLLGVCDPELYGFDRTSSPHPEDIVCWAGNGALLSRASRYISGCRYSHCGRALDDGVVGNMTLDGYAEEPGPTEAVSFDLQYTAEQRAVVSGAIRERAAGIRGYGWHWAILLAAETSACLTRKSNVFDATDTLLRTSLLWLAGMRIVTYVWLRIGLLRVGVNYGIRRPNAPLWRLRLATANGGPGAA